MNEKENSKIYKITSLFTLIISACYLTYSLLKVENIITNIMTISIPIFIFIISFLLFASALSKNNSKISIIFEITIILFIGFNILNSENIILLPKEETIISYVNKSYSEINDWANSKNIKLTVEYEFSDTIENNNIIRTNINEGTFVKDIKEIVVTISKGPDYDKIVVVPSMIGQNIDDVINFVNKNYIIGLTIDYEFSDEEKDIVIKQDNNGDIRRNQEWNIKVSLGNIQELDTNIEMINLKGSTLFDSLLWLKRNNIKYNVEYEFNDSINRNIIIDQSINENEIVNINENEVTIKVSKGKAIVVPELKDMNVEEITNWVINNNLKISFNEIYDEEVEMGKIIESSINKDDQIEVGTLVNITISKGQIKMPAFNSLYSFKEWANKYNIMYNESYEYSDTVEKGAVISYSYKENEVINPDDVIYVKVSLGKSISIPSFIGKSKNEASELCSKIGIKCTFTNGGYTDYDTNIVYNQSRNVGSKVTNGSTINLTLSKGKPVTKELFIQSNWLVIGNADSTIESLTKQFAKNFPGVNFKFEKVKDNVLSSGTIRKDSPTNKGTKVTQGKTYTIYIVSN